MKIFVMHYSKLVERKKHIVEHFAKHGITEYEFIELYDKDSITDTERSIYEGNFHSALMSLHLKHLHAYRQIADKYDTALIFEDDVILSDNFLTKLNLYLTQIPATFDMVYLGDACNQHIPTNVQSPNTYIYRNENGYSRCTDSYIISKKSAKKICSILDTLQEKISAPIDHWLNQICSKNNFEVYWAEPTIVTQGSHNNTFRTSLGSWMG